MDYFSYRNGRLFAEDVDVEQIASQVGTPTYIYSKATFLDHVVKMQQAYRKLDTTICYAVKACGNISILRFLAQAGCGFDIVSGGELFRALKAGADMSKVVYAGVGKTDAEICAALDAGIAYFNIESEQELQTLIDLARRHKKIVKVALRVNPDVDYKTHQYMTTGKKETKFGIDIGRVRGVFESYRHNGAVEICAIHVHLGTGGKTIDPYVAAVKKVLPLIKELRDAGHTVEALDLGGGYGADYESETVPSAEDYAAGLVPLLKDMNLKLVLEPGKSICANAAILLTRVLFTKRSGQKKFVIVDAGMNDLIRPALYDAFHFIWPARVAGNLVPARRSMDTKMDGTDTVDVVGPIGESGDFFARDRAIAPVERGDLMAIFTAGAYGFTMASNYNARPLPAEVLVDGGAFSVIRKRQTYADLVAPEE
jgi:diaminopimelate decarboxylase